MSFKQMVTRMQVITGFPYEESKDALEHMVESIAVRLDDRTRRDFAEELPEHLQDIALSVRATEDNSRPDIILDFMHVQAVPRLRAKKQVLAAWEVINQVVTSVELAEVESHLPEQTVLQLNAPSI